MRLVRDTLEKSMASTLYSCFGESPWTVERNGRLLGAKFRHNIDKHSSATHFLRVNGSDGGKRERKSKLTDSNTSRPAYRHGGW